MNTNGTQTGRRGSMLRSIKMVAWSFLGIRKGSESQHDTAGVSLPQIIAVAFVVLVVFVLSLIALVHWVVAK